LTKLLERARVPTWRIFAENAPYDCKDQLKARGYRWNGGTSHVPRGWYIDVDEADREAELAFLQEEIYQRPIQLLITRIDAYDRFSDRC
jgi:DNA polymerase-3 subunit epsilon